MYSNICFLFPFCYWFQVLVSSTAPLGTLTSCLITLLLLPAVIFLYSALSLRGLQVFGLCLPSWNTRSRIKFSLAGVGLRLQADFGQVGEWNSRYLHLLSFYLSAALFSSQRRKWKENPHFTLKNTFFHEKSIHPWYSLPCGRRGREELSSIDL